MKDKELKFNIMDEVGNIINTITTKIVETQDEFIFQTISEWWMYKTQRMISKQELIDALTLNKKLVRCKDCKNVCMEEATEMMPDMPFYAVCTLTDEVHEPEWFCADGERKDDADRTNRR